MVMMRNPIPRGYRILIKLKKKFETKTKSGIYINSSAKEVNRANGSSAEAYVLALGEEAYRDFKTPWCKVGDLIQFKQYAGNEIEGIEEDEIYQFINDKEVVGVFEGEEMR